MFLLKPYSEIPQATENELFVEADLQLLSEDTLELSFRWQDSNHQMLFEKSPCEIRATQLWEQTCFEAFVQPEGHSQYFEINLSVNKAWNVFEFSDYRSPQPPQECSSAQLLNFQVRENQLRVQIKFKGINFKKINASLCAVVVLKDKVTYWSIQHADSKPNFHHFKSFTIERNAP